MNDFFEFAKVYGLPMALVVAFILRDFLREKVLTARVQKLEDYNTRTLTNLVVSVRQVAAMSAEQLRENTEVLKRVNGRMKLWKPDDIGGKKE